MYRKIGDFIKNNLKKTNNGILCIYGARQIGKTYIINKIIADIFNNCIEINFDYDNKNEQLFKNVKSTDDFYIQLSAKYGRKIGNYDDTIIFLDEIQIYPQYFSLLKQFDLDRKYHFICSGSELGIKLKNQEGISPMGSVIEKRMYPMDFEEYLIANGVGDDVFAYLRKNYEEKTTVNEATHNYIMKLFYSYLYVGGLPECVKIFIEDKNISLIKDIQRQTYKYYCNDASKYDLENRLRINRLYDMILSNMSNSVKRIQVSKINNNVRDTYSNYIDEFDYLINSGIALDNKAIAEPKFPLVQSSSKNLIKLYLNDVGILSEKLYRNNINAIIENKTGVNLGSLYETFVAQELMSHDHNLFYYDRRSVGEVDFLVDDYNNLSVLPIEVKSGKEGYEYRALPKLLKEENYRIQKGYILSNNRETIVDEKIVKLPIYNVMFI